MMMISRRLKHLVMFPLCVPFFLMGVVTVQAATYYVATTGDDVNSGSALQPFKTIKKGLRFLHADDTLYIRGGTYPEGINSNSQTIPSGSSWQNAPVISAYSGETVVLKPSGGAEVINLAHPYIQYVIFNGFVLDASGLQRSCSVGYGCSYGVSGTNGAHHVRFTNIEIKNAAGSGVLTSQGASSIATDFEFIGCDVHHNGGSHWDHGLYISTSGNLIKNSKVHDNAGYGIHIYTDKVSMTANNNTIDGNDVYDNGAYGTSDPGILLDFGKGNRAMNNIVHGNKNGIQVGNPFSSESSAFGTKVYNNTVYGNGNGVGINIFSSSSQADVRNNILSKNGGTMLDAGSNTTSTNNRYDNLGTGDLSPPPTPENLVVN